MKLEARFSISSHQRLIVHFSAIRPYLYHLTDRSNLEFIRETKTLFPASSLMKRAGRLDLTRLRRLNHERLIVDGQTILVRDQAPLCAGNMTLPANYEIGDFVENLNGRVFFWPGTVKGPIRYGARHFERYRTERPVILRVEYESLMDANRGSPPEFCRYNSGAPRCAHGHKSPRGPHTFVPATSFQGTTGQIVEVTFESEIVLPTDTLFGTGPAGPWHTLFTSR